MGALPEFELGRLLATPGVLEAVPAAELENALCRHAQCDWGELAEIDRLANDDALISGGRLFSAYRSSGNVKFWIITEADRSCTTMLLPSEY